MIKINKIFFDKQKLRKICQRHKIDLLILHGSYATGHQTKESDIDIGILIHGHFVRKEYWEIVDELTGILGDKCDTVLLNNAETMISYQTALNGVPLYEHKKGLFDNFMTTAISRYQDAGKFRKLEKDYVRSHIKSWRPHG